MAVNYFLKLDPVQGESQAKNHVNEIQVLSWSWGGSQASSVSATAGSGAGKVSMSDLNLMIAFDRSIPGLIQGLTAGRHFPTATLSGVKPDADASNYMTLVLTDAFINSLELSASSDAPSVSVSFAYKAMRLDYDMQKSDGTVTGAGTVKYDLTTNVTS